MTLNLALLALTIVFLISILTTLIGKKKLEQKGGQKVNNFLLGGKQLGENSIINLLLSSSFGINALFYAAWLGFVIGGWALLIQAAWALSFFLLIPFSKEFRNINSLHDFLGQRFGNRTKILAAICSLVGIIYLSGWEVGIGESSIGTLLSSGGEINTGDTQLGANVIVLGIVIATLLYTILGGLKGNANVNKLLNLVKITIVFGITFLLLKNFLTTEGISKYDSFFPSFEKMKESLGVWGLITNILFNLSWQFVDNSSWQSIIAGSGNERSNTSTNLRNSGLAIFLTIGLFGTLLGISLSNVEGVTPDNILTIFIDFFPGYELLVVFCMLLLIIASVMSLLDGMFLASALTLVLDIFEDSRMRLNWIKSQNQVMTIIRVLIIIIAIISVWGIKFIFELSGASLFDFVYIVIITQLALFGPTIIGLASKREKTQYTWISIIVGLAVGFGSTILGTSMQQGYLVDGAGTFTILASLIVAYLTTTSNKEIHEKHIQGINN